MELEEMLARLRNLLDPLEYAAVMAKYFGANREDWRRLQMIGLPDGPVIAGEALIDYLSERGLEKFRVGIWPVKE